ncbi:MAG: DUF2461 family protein [Clostridium sp.]|nr:DUF2461 family protein [Clostridium sp.]
MGNFKGFDKNTNCFLFELQFCNTIQNQNENLVKYKEYITEPINLLYFDLLDTVDMFEVDFETKPSRCISTPYTDRRFSPTVPLKEYMYLRFRQAKKKTDILGLYFDMGSECYGYGLQIYKPTAKGMELLREKIAANVILFSKILDELAEKGFEIKGSVYKKDHFPQLAACSAKSILNMKSFRVSKSKPISETVYSENLKTEIENAFLDLKKLVELLN